ncbi:hypothetical protein MSS2_04706 [Mycobacterium marinum]|uniref:hypothetical protein n=1 Tax=Mycobacterium marinum TaxID=1781 RepID=UPI000E3D7121|nr:hypothetical protein [Mycobacterium marinum]RFZ48539.1 hypothetical protein MSS2_04706 [Mycobacterium marinum]
MNPVKVNYEGWRPEVLNPLLIDPSSNSFRAGIGDLAQVLGELVDTTEGVSLVVPVDLAEAVRLRQPDVPFSSQRGSGTVGARTMPVGDGQIDVIVDANFLIANDAAGLAAASAGRPILNRDGLSLVRRTIVHEAQHVVMNQRGSSFEDYLPERVDGEARAHLFDVARLMCDEHRAESKATQLTTPDPPSVDDVLDVLCHLGQELQAADALYQSAPGRHGAVGKLRDDVYIACGSFWTAVSYWAAQYRREDEIAEPSESIQTLGVWQRYVGPIWGTMAAALSAVPVIDLSTTKQDLHAAAMGVLVAVEKSLSFIGFRYFDDGANGPAFYVDRHDFPSARA